MMDLKQAIDYLQPIADSTPLAGYGAALRVALDAMRAQEARQNPKTKADRIRAMSDEELVELLVMEKGGFFCAVCEIADQHDCDMDCRGHCAKWLQQPAEEVQA